jgi:acyl-CoA thioesterase FadM
MARVKIDRPKQFHFSTEHSIHVGELNYGNHLGNDKVLTIVQDARIKFFGSFGMSELHFWGVSLIQGDAAIVYRSEGYLHDQLKIEIAVSEMGSSSFDLVYEIHNMTTNKPLARVKTGMVCYDYDEKRVVKCPEEWKELFADDKE